MAEQKNITQPHDHYFRQLMSNPKILYDFLKNHLPLEIQNQMDFATLTPQKNTYISSEFKKQEVDLLFLTEFKHKLGYIYLLIENQSVSDKYMPFRLLKYMWAIMEDHLRRNKHGTLPIVYPLVIYAGKSKYSHSMNIFDLFGEQQELARDILWQPFKLIDLTQESEEELKDKGIYGLMARVMKYATQRKPSKNQLLLILHDMDKLAKNNNIDYFIDNSLMYIFFSTDLELDEFVKLIRQELSTINEEKLMTIAERVRQEGRQEGKQEVAQHLLSYGMDLEQIIEVTGLSKEEVLQLQR